MTSASVALALIYLASLTCIVIVLALRHGGRREEPLDDHDALSESRFTIPVSLLVPVRDEAAPLTSTIQALLSLNYPEFEVIVVVEGLPAESWKSLKAEWALEPKEFYYRQSLTTADVQKIYRSAKDARLMMVDKTAVSSRADALNCGVNLARYRYVGSVEPGMAFDPNALLRAMSAPLRDPAGVLAATSHIEADVVDAIDGTAIADDFRARDANHLNLSGALQRLASIRSLMDSRLVWRTLQAALGPHDGVAVWRRDALVQLGGFSTRAIDPDLEMMIRLQATARIPAGAPNTSSLAPHPSSLSTSVPSGRVVRSGELFGHIAPRSLAATIRLRTRRQLAAMQTLWACRRLAAPTFAYIMLSEVVTPLAEAWVVAGTAAAALAGWLPWSAVLLVIVLLSFGNAAISSVALLMRGSAPGAPDERTLMRLLLVSPLDFVVSGSIGAYARFAALWALVKSIFSTPIVRESAR